MPHIAFRAGQTRIACVALGLVLSIAAAASARPATPTGYHPTPGSCGGYPRAPVEMAPGLCMGIVLAPPPSGLRPSRRTVRSPRTLLPRPNGDVLVVDLGSWEPGHGVVWRLTPTPGGAPQLKRLLSGLDLPHTLAEGPDGRLYLAEMSRIRRFDPDAADPRDTLETVVEGLPDNRLHANRHPLSSFIFDADGALLVNVGAPSDQCPRTGGQTVCPEAAAARPQAAIWRFAYLGGGRWEKTPTAFARGLRNSLAMVRTRAGRLLQAENSIDVADRFWPPEEINVLTPGANYGWPYCVGFQEPAPAWKDAPGLACGDYAAPVLLLPPHGAPLSLVEYHGAMFPELEGRLLVSLHGYRSTGARILAFDLDADGLPVAQKRAVYEVYGAGAKAVLRAYGRGPQARGRVLTPGWNAVAGRRPAGSPAGLAVAADGAIWVADDRNGAILRIARDGR